MSSQANPTQESFDRQRPPTAVSGRRPLYWSVRRELWENRAIYLAPACVAGVYLFGFLFYLHALPHLVRAAIPPEAVEQRGALLQPFDFAAAAVMGVAFIIGLLYCLEALYGERRDRSLLFWKSLPVSDLTAVLAKASIPLLVVPAT